MKQIIRRLFITIYYVDKVNYIFNILNYIFKNHISSAKIFNISFLHSYISVGIIALLFCCSSVSGYSQNKSVSKDDLIFSFNYHNGSISQKEYSYPLKRSQYAEFGFLWQTNGAKQWHQDYHFPEVGFGLAIGNHGNDTIYGNSIAVYPMWRYRIFERKYFKMSARLAIGFAYFFKPYDRLENPNNFLIGSRINNYTSFGLLIQLTPHKNLSINAGANLFHYSAAHAQIPNLGLNDMPLTFGISYKIGHTERKASAPKDSASKKIAINIRTGLGIQKFSESISPAYGPTYPLYSLSIFASKNLNSISELHLGLTGSYSQAYYDVIKIEEWYKKEEFKHSLIFGVIVGHEFLISHFGFLIEADFHFYNPFYKKFYAYAIEPINSVWIKSILGGRLGFNYYPFKKSYIMKNNVGIGLYLKTHLGQADCVEMNLMYSF